MVRCLSLARALGVRPLMSVRGGAVVRETALALGADVLLDEGTRVLSAIEPDVVVIDDPIAKDAKRWMAAARRVGALVVTVHDLGIGARGADLVIDGSDNFATRLAVSDCCVALRIPLLSAAALQFQGQVGLFRSRPCYRCFVGDAFDTDDCDTCAELGVLGALTGTVGSFAALLAINGIVGIGEDQAGRLHLFDGEKFEWRTIKIPPDPRCRSCGSA